MALMRTLSACVAVAEKAGGVLRDIMASGNLGIVDKGGINNLQTLADKKAQLLIVSSLMKHSPKVSPYYILRMNREYFRYKVPARGIS